LLDGVDSTTQAALQSDDEEFYGQQTSSDSSASGESDNDELSTDFTPNMSQGDIDSRARLVSTGRVTRTDSGNASGVFVPQNDPLYEHVAAKLAGECCSENCLSVFDVDEVYQLLLNFHEMSKEEKCMFILGKLHVMSRAGELTSHARKKGDKRQRVTFSYAFDHRQVCKQAFMFLHDLGEKQLKNIAKHLKSNGIVPPVHGNTGKVPSTTYPFEVVRDVVQFISNHAEVHGLPQPAARRGRADTPPIYLTKYLPASQNFKIVHQCYVKASMQQDPSRRLMEYRSFVDVWHKCMPHIKFMTPRTDVCSKCERFRQQIKDAVLEDRKASLTAAFSQHLSIAQTEREYYLECCKRSASELAVCSGGAPRYAHYTFDFAEQLHLPHHSRQEGPLYFKVCRKVQLFGICCDSNNVQINYLVDESQTIGQNGKKSHGPNSVISMLDHYFSHHSLNEAICQCHADNCVGQNKNRFVLGYFAWRIITGKHDQLYLSFMEVGHTRCLVDGHFGLIKKIYRTMDCDTVQHLADATTRSSGNNKPQLFPWEWREWDTFINSLFKAIPNITKYHHFRLDSDSPGIVHAKERIDSTETHVSIFKRGVSVREVRNAGLPRSLSPAGLSQERQQYLYTQIRPFVRPDFQDITCPSP
jgi:hypothetical protein